MFDESAHPLETERADATQRCRVVLDTSVLIADPTCVHHFTGADVVVPLMVIEELDGLKTRRDDVGRSARSALRLIEDIRVRAGGSLALPALVHDDGRDGTLRVEVSTVTESVFEGTGLDGNKPDNVIIGAAAAQRADAVDTVIVSNDAALRIKAAHLGLHAVEHVPQRGADAVSKRGWVSVEASSSTIDGLYAGDAVDVADLVYGDALCENEFAVVRAGTQSALVRARGGRLTLANTGSMHAWGLSARSKEQRFALELLLDPGVGVVALDGRAGTGKTLLSIAAGLEQVVEHRRYERLSVYRPLIPVGRADVGFLPGGLDEKLDPWMAAIYDAVVALTERHSQRDAQVLIDELYARGQLSLESVTFLRGRSLHGQFVVVDEAQNLEPATLKTILTRVGAGTKIVFTGDTSQIDAPYLGESNNALAVLITAFRGQSCFGHVTLAACERGEIANLAAELL